MYCDMNQELRTIKLGGALGRKFGRIHRLAVESPAEAIRALCVLKQGFREFLEGSERNGFGYKVLTGNVAINKDEAEQTLHIAHGAQTTFTFAPKAIGAKSGLGQILLGVVLVVAAFWTAGWSLTALMGSVAAKGVAMFGASLILGGVTQMLAPKIKTGDPKEDDKSRPSYLFNGAVNTTAQGQPVPILYGRLMVGSAVVSAGITSKDIPIDSASTAGTDNVLLTKFK